MKGGLRNRIIVVVLSFFLTAIVGGFLGTWLQVRSWAKQNDADLREIERALSLIHI